MYPLEDFHVTFAMGRVRVSGLHKLPETALALFEYLQVSIHPFCTWMEKNFTRGLARLANASCLTRHAPDCRESTADGSTRCTRILASADTRSALWMVHNLG